MDMRHLCSGDAPACAHAAEATAADANADAEERMRTSMEMRFDVRYELLKVRLLSSTACA